MKASIHNTPPRRKQFAEIYILLALIFLGGWITACRKTNNIDHEIPDNPIEMARQRYLEDSVAFQQTALKPNPNFRQSLKRNICWSELKIKENGRMLVPVTYILPDNVVDSSGERTLNVSSWLWITLDSITLDYNFQLISLIPEDKNKNWNWENFTGVMLTEDFFVGEVTHSVFENGIAIAEPKNRPFQNSSTNQLRASGMGCIWVEVASVCVGDVNGGSAPDVCSGRYELNCSSSKPPVDLTRDLGGENDGGGGHSGTPDEDDEIIDSLQGYPCAQALLAKIPLLSDQLSKLINSTFGNAETPKITYVARKL